LQLKTEKSTDTAINPQAEVKVIQANHVIEISHSTNKGKGLDKIKRISKEHYMYVDTGELGEYKNGQTKADTEESLRRTLHRLRMMINANFEGGQAELFITLTYAENMICTQQLQKDYRAFEKRLRYKYPNLELIAVTEPQRRGAWHWHILAKDTTGEKLVIPNQIISDLWKKGFTQTKRLHNCDNVGAYLTAYLTNIDIETNGYSQEFWEELKAAENKDIIIIEKEGKRKAFVKGGRLDLYPAGMKIYRATKGIIRPQQEKMTYAQAKEKAQGSAPSFTQRICISAIANGTEQHLQTVQYEQYNTKRITHQSDVTYPDSPQQEREQPDI